MTIDRYDASRQPQNRHQGPGGRGLAPGEKPKNFRRAIGNLTRYMNRYKILIVVVIIAAAASTVFQVVGPKIMGHATTELAEGLMRKIGGTGGIDFETILRILVMTLTLYLISAALSFVQGWIMTGISQKVACQPRNAKESL